MMLSKELLIRRMGVNYDQDEREVVEDKIDEGYDSLLRLAIRNRAQILDSNGDLWRETGFIYGIDMKPKFIVKWLIHVTLSLSSHQQCVLLCQRII